MSETKKKSGPWVDFQIVTIFFMMLIPAAWVFSVVVLSPTVNKATWQPYSCVIESVRLDESSGGPRTSTSHSTVFIHTSNCGVISTTRFDGTGVRSYEELVQKFEEHKGQVVVFHIGRMQVNSNNLIADRIEF